MARTNHVKSYQGKRTCQHITAEGEHSWSTPERCGESKNYHHEAIGAGVDLGHEFDPGTLNCGACSEPIKPGDAYKYKNKKTGPYSSVKLSRHTGCPEWKASELTSSAYLAAMYVADEDDPGIDVSCNDPEDIVGQLEARRDHFAQAAEQMAEIRNEAADAIEDGFGHETGQSAELREEGEYAESCAMELEGWSPQEFDPPEDQEDWEDAFEEWAEEQDNEITSMWEGVQG